jgi:3-oxoacyl-[acyl-carrier protein] reductase
LYNNAFYQNNAFAFLGKASKLQKQAVFAPPGIWHIPCIAVITNLTIDLKHMNTTENKLSGKVAIVTGASKGIGAEIAKQLAGAGASVVVNYSSSKTGAAAVVNDISRQGGRAVAVQGDVSKQSDIDRLFAETKKHFGRLDVLVNNAGIYEFSPLENITEEHFHKQFNLNVLGLILVSQAAVKQFGSDGGSIVNISSVVSNMAFPNASVYSGTKGAVDAITRSLAAELGPRKIRVNAINPGMVETEGVHTAGIAESDMRKQVEAQTPLGRIGQPIDIAGAAVFLASNHSAWITGETFRISGGLR